MQDILAILPRDIETKVLEITKKHRDDIEEIRLRINRPIEVTAMGKTKYLPHLFQPAEAEQLLNKLSQHSFYTLDEELKRGYITVSGGHRIGLAGKVILEKGRVKAIRYISSFNIRIAREKLGIAEKWIPYLYDSGWLHTMIIGAPQSGKTTFLRDVARMISSGKKDYGIRPMKVGIVDERSEIAGCYRGVPQLTFGVRVDVLDACPKAEGMMMMIRSMSPEVLVVDEIGRKEDTDAILEAVNAGIRLIMTTHGENFDEVASRPILKPIFDAGIFQRFIELKRTYGPGQVLGVKDKYGMEIYRKASVT